MPKHDVQAEGTEVTDAQRFKQLLIDAICGVGFPSLILASQCEQAGLATMQPHSAGGPLFTWDVIALGAVEVDQLQALYDGLCALREENFTPTDLVEDFTPSLIISGGNLAR